MSNKGNPTYGSLFAGVGGIDIGFDKANWDCKFQVEWDKHCQQTLAYHWPDVPRWGDVSDVNGAEIPPVDLITFGSPCQDLSLAGKRAGLMNGSRSNLFFEATRIIKEMRNATGNVFPKWAIWENVPGAFSSNTGDDFEAVIQEMVDIGGHHVEWHIVDAQFFGVPQRRRRVFVIACFDSAILNRGGKEILPVSEGRRRNSSSRNKAGKNSPATLTESIGTSSELGSGESVANCISASLYHHGSVVNQDANNGHVVVEPYVKVVRSGARDAEGTLPAEVWRENEVAPTLNVYDNTGESRATVVIAFDNSYRDGLRIQQGETFNTLSAKMGTGGNNVPFVATDDTPILMRQREGKPGGGKGPLLSDTSLTLAGGNDQVLFQPNAIPIQDAREIEKHQNGLGIGNEGDPMYTLDQTGGQAVAYPIQGTIIGRSDTAGPQRRGVGEDGDPMYTLDTISAHGVAYTTSNIVGTLAARDYKGVGNQYVEENKLIIESDIAPTLRSGGDGGVPSSRGEHLIVEPPPPVVIDMVVRRLTPIECERLMGWPDNHTLHRADGKQNSDTTRYKMCGNGVASPVAEFIAQHLYDAHNDL